MSEQPLDFSRSMQIVRRGLAVVCAGAALGLLAGGVYAALTPRQAVSIALVLLPPNARDAPTQAAIATSDSVLGSAGPEAHLAMSPQELRRRIDVAELGSGVLSVQAEASTAVQAERLANAVANSYISYVGGLPPRQQLAAQMLASATTASRGSSIVWTLIWAGLGTLAGALVAVVSLLAVNRRNRRLRLRDEIAGATGVPVLASVRARHVSRAHGWAEVLDRYEPSPKDAWQLGSALGRLCPDGAASVPDGDGSGYSVLVLSLRSDRRALALGPQLAVFASGKGINTSLIIGPQQDDARTASLRAACATYRPAAGTRGHLHVSVADPRGPGSRGPEASLTVVVATVDGVAPQVTAAVRTNTTVLAVSPGAATAEQLARTAAAVAAEERRIDGLLIADPDKADRTSGRMAALTRPSSALRPTRSTPVPMASTLSTISQPVRTTR